MDWPSECAVIVPCLNEAATIGTLVREIRERLPKAVVVDDGSHDQTAALAAEAGAVVVHHASPLGKGAALRTGWRHAGQLGCQWTLSMDGDGQHAPTDIPKFLRCEERTGAKLVVGNRMASPAAMPWVRRRTNRYMSRRLSRLAGRELPDTQCGFRLMHLGAWTGLEIQTTQFEIESELLLAFATGGHRIEFVDVEVIYRGEESKIRPLRDAVRWFRWLRTAQSQRLGASAVPAATLAGPSAPAR